MSNKPDETVLVTITKSKPKRLLKSSRANLSLSSKASLESDQIQDLNNRTSTKSDDSRHTSVTFFMATDDGGPKQYELVTLTPTKAGESIGQDKISRLRKSGKVSLDVNVRGLSKYGLIEKFGESFEDENLETESSDTRYFLNYKGRLSVKLRKSGPVKTEGLLGDDIKVDIATSILCGIISNIEEDEEPSQRKQSLLEPVLITSKRATSSQMTTYVSSKGRRQKRIKKRDIKQNKNKMKSIADSEAPKSGISSVVKILKLPIDVCGASPFLDTKAQMEKVLLAKSSKIHTDFTSDPTEFNVEKQKENIDKNDQDLLSSSVKESAGIESPFELCWCFGFNTEVPILNLSTEDRSLIVFANSQFAVLHDFYKDTMSFMQGHLNEVSCFASDSLGSLLVTADRGLNSRIIIWDMRPCVVCVLEHVHPQGSSHVVLSCDTEYLVAVSPAPYQCLQLWRWRKDTTQPSAIKCFNDILGEVKKLTINPECAEEFAVTFEHGINFVFFDKNINKVGEGLLLDCHQLPSKFGDLTDTTFLKSQDVAAMSSTTMGYVVVWLEDTQNKKFAQKHARLYNEGITHIQAVDGLVAVVTMSGCVSFLELGLTVLYWFNSQHLGPIVSLAFNLNKHSDSADGLVLPVESRGIHATPVKQETKAMEDATLYNRPFFVRNFILSTVSGRVVYFNQTTDVPKYLLYPSGADYTAIDVLPNSQYLCAGTSQGCCVMFDTEKRMVIVSRQLTVPDGLCKAVSQLCYSPTGYILACGMHTGDVWLMEPLTLSPWPGMPLVHCSYCITDMVFSPCCDYLAVADSTQCVTLYGVQQPRVYLVGQYQAHNKPIRGMFFEIREEELYLYSLAADLNLVCFHVSDNGFEMKVIHRVEQTAVPRCILSLPDSDNLWLMVNSDMKFKLLDSETMKCCKTLQAPDLDCPINFLKLLPGLESSYLVFGTDHHLGLLILPLDGNPHKAVATLSSPTYMIRCKLLSDGKHVFTISENCSAVNMWRVNTLSVEESCRRGGTGLAPYLDLLGGGSETEQQLREIFMVGQFMHLGERLGAMRSLENYLPVCEVVNSFQALGFFPSKEQIENMMYELKDKKYVTFEQFVQLFVNHQSSRGLSYEDLLKAFCNFYESVYYIDRDSTLLPLTSNPIFDSASFIEHITTAGEGMSSPELALALSILLSSRTPFSEDYDLNSIMPKELSFQTFIKDLLGFPFEETSTQSCSSLLPEPPYPMVHENSSSTGTPP